MLLLLLLNQKLFENYIKYLEIIGYEFLFEKNVSEIYKILRNLHLTLFQIILIA